MSGPGKSQSSFNFPSSGTSGGSSLFGQPNTGNQGGGNLFGSAGSQPASSAPSSFGGSNANASANPFGGIGGSTGTSNLFGGSGASGAASGNVFGGANKPASTGFNFGTANSQPTSTAAGTSNLFGAAPSSSGQPPISITTSQPATSTPAKPSFNFANPSTTPAGPPPASGGLFNNLNKPQEQKSNPFGNLGSSTGTMQDTSAAPAPNMFSLSTVSETPASKPATSNLFGGGGQPNLFNTSKPSDETSTPKGAPTTNIFGSTPSQSASGGGAPTSNLFGNLNASKPDTSKPQAPSLFSSPAPAADAAKPSLFQNLGAQSSTPASTNAAAPSIFSTPASTATSNATKSAFSFPSAPTSQPAVSSSSTTSSTPAPNIFGNLGNKPASSAASTTSAAAPSTFSLGQPTASSASTSAPAAGTTSTAPATTSNLFGAPKAPAAQQSSQPSSAKPAENATTNLGASTAGGIPSAQSRLKNKSMDEIITRWASDLAKHTKDFHEQATKVSEWDQMLVENSDKIQKLYGDTLEAERATTEVERQLTAVENDQNELSLWLDHYEGEVNKLLSASQMGQGDTLMGPDKERERTYRLAEKLSGRLEEMGQDLGSMVEEINEASGVLNRTSRSDDPLSQVVKVLNGHLLQLQAIDQGAAELQNKVKTAQQASRGAAKTNGYKGPVSEAADGFYRSYMGRR